MKRKEFVLVVILIFFGLCYHFFSSEDFTFFESCSSDSPLLLDKNNSLEFVEKVARFENIEKLRIHNPAGDIKIQKSDDSSVVVNTIIRVFHRKRDKAVKIKKDLLISIKKNLENLELGILPRGRFPSQRVRILFRVFIPEKVELDIMNRYGDIDISGVGQRPQVDGKYGNIFIKDLVSDLNIIHGYGRITLDNISGKCSIDTRYSTLRVFNARSMEIGSKHSRIKIVGLEEGISLQNAHDQIDINDVKGNINLDSRNSKIRLLNIDSDLVVLKNTYNDVFIENLWSENVDISVSHGDLVLRYFEIQDKINIINRYSKVKLEYSKSIKPQYKITLSYGKILNETLVPLNVLSGRYEQVYTSIDGSPSITIENTYGDIILRNIENELEK